MSIICHLRDHCIRIENNQEQTSTSVFGGFTAHNLLKHEDKSVRKATPSILTLDKASSSRTSANRVFILHLHADDFELWSSAFKAEFFGHVVLASTVRMFQVPVGWPEGRTHACEWTPNEFANPPERLAKWLEQLQTLSIDQVDWDLLIRDNAEPMLAFRLICEAKRECNGGTTKSKAFNTELTIHAPDKLSDWLQAFEACDLESAIETIGAGCFSAQVKAVLEAAESDWDTLSNAIEKFEAEYAKLQAAPF